MRSICLFCGSSTSANPRHLDAAAIFGDVLAKRGGTLVYGGSSVGSMGRAADAAIAGGAQVIGVLPRGLFDKEIAHRGLSRLVLVESMHERKANMARLADAFVALPGGLGTLEELFEVWTWAVLGIHKKAVGLLNVDGYFDPLLAFLDAAVAQGFLQPAHRDLLFVDDDPYRLLDRMAAGPPSAPPRYLTPNET